MWASQVVLVVKKKKKKNPANAGEVRDMGSIPGLGRSPGGGHKDSDMTEETNTHTHTHKILCITVRTIKGKIEKLFSLQITGSEVDSEQQIPRGPE